MLTIILTAKKQKTLDCGYSDERCHMRLILYAHICVMYYHDYIFNMYYVFSLTYAVSVVSQLSSTFSFFRCYYKLPCISFTSLPFRYVLFFLNSKSSLKTTRFYLGGRFLI